MNEPFVSEQLALDQVIGRALESTANARLQRVGAPRKWTARRTPCRCPFRPVSSPPPRSAGCQPGQLGAHAAISARLNLSIGEAVAGLDFVAQTHVFSFRSTIFRASATRAVNRSLSNGLVR